MPQVTDILEDLRKKAKGDDELSVGDVVAKFEGRGFGPLLLAPALLAILPTGAIPGVPTVCGIFVLLVSVQIVCGKSHPWIPKRFRKLSVTEDKFESTFEKVKPYAEKFDRLLQPRLEFLTGTIATTAIALVAIFLALCMIPLEAVPFATAIPGASLALLATGLTAKDGLFTILGFLAAAGTGTFVYFFWPW